MQTFTLDKSNRTHFGVVRNGEEWHLVWINWPRGEAAQYKFVQDSSDQNEIHDLCERLNSELYSTGTAKVAA